jgi:hypothetical protein
MGDFILLEGNIAVSHPLPEWLFRNGSPVHDRPPASRNDRARGALQTNYYFAIVDEKDLRPFRPNRLPLRLGPNGSPLLPQHAQTSFSYLTAFI